MPRKKRESIPEPATAPPLSHTQERVRVTTSQVAAGLAPGSHDDAVTAVNVSHVPELPAAWLERLLTLTCELPVAEGEDSVVRAVVDALAGILPLAGIGVCFVRAPGARQQLIRRHPLLGNPNISSTPDRLFPGFAHERTVAIAGDSSGSTLHVASDDASILDHGSSIGPLLRKAGMVLRRGLEHARLHAQIKGAEGEVATLNSQMVQAEKLASLGQIAAGMVHELNNPLTSIVAYTDFLTKRWLAKREASEPDELERLRRIGESAHRLLRFTRDLVTYARPSGGKPIPVALHGVIDQAVLFCEHVVLEAKAKIERQYVEGMAPIRALPEQLTQVFVNLITNACHAVSEGGVIRITTELDGESFVRVIVADTGHGIAAQNLTRVFDPFFTTKGEGRGTGLGLSIVKSIVEHHNGQIWAESEAQQGARFILVLPVR